MKFVGDVMINAMRTRLLMMFVLSYLCIAAVPAKGATKTMAITVIDQTTDKPLPGVAIVIVHNNVRAPQTTDNNGTASASYDERTSYMTISCRIDGYVPTFVRWSHNSNDPIALPDSFTVRMPVGKAVGGLIVDEDGKPVAGAKVILNRYSNPLEGMPSIESGLHDQTVQTDSAGKWVFNGYPPGTAAIRIRLQHADFINDQQFSGDAKQLLNQSLRLVIKRGVEVTGEVVSVRGKPIHGAKVTTVADAHVVNSYGATTRTSADGTFRLPHLSPQQVPLTITATGFAGVTERHHRTGDAPLKIVLPDPSRLAVRVVDDHGKPLSKVYVSVQSWRESESLAWSAMTDIDGHFAWTDAPSDGVTFSLNKSGYRYLYNKELTASPDEQMLTMLPSPRASGTVTDAITHQPIDNFTIVPGTGYWQGVPPFFSFDNAKQFKGGTYDFPIGANNDTLASYVRIEAKGYKPVVSPPITSVATFSPELQHAPDITGTLVDPDGKPLAGTQVCLAMPGTQIDIFNNEVRPDSVMTSKTDEQGHFQFGPQIGDIYFCVVNDGGFLYVKGDSSATKVDLKLKRWSRMEGAFRPGGRKGEYAQVNFERYRDNRDVSPRLSWIVDCEIGQAGNLSAAHVPSFDGETCYLQFGQYDRKAGKDARWVIPVRPEPGNAIAINIEAGCTLTGHLVPATPADKVADVRGLIVFVPAHHRPADHWPASLADATAAAAPHYSTGIRADGSFTMPSIPAGNYEYCTLCYTKGSEFAASGAIRCNPATAQSIWETSSTSAAASSPATQPRRCSGERSTIIRFARLITRANTSSPFYGTATPAEPIRNSPTSTSSRQVWRQTKTSRC